MKLPLEKKSRDSKPAVRIVRWSARVTGLALFLLWGAFFIEHLEWFGDPSRLPPLKVFISMFFHLAMLAAFIIALKWELAGGIAIMAFSALFFGYIAGLRLFHFFAMNSVPALLYMVSWMLGRRKGSPPAKAEGSEYAG